MKILVCTDVKSDSLNIRQIKDVMSISSHTLFISFTAVFTAVYNKIHKKLNSRVTAVP